MSRDYKAPAKKSGGNKGGAGSLLIGILIGLLMGLGIALAVAWYINKMPTPFVNRTPSPPKGEPLKIPDVAKSDDKTTKPADGKPRFDFYKILPGAEEPKIAKSDRPTVARLEPPKTTEAPAKTGERVWLQAGAFANEADAENLKARLALSGWEAGIQAATLPDKTIRFRVRLGPYDIGEEVGKIKSELGRRGFNVIVSKNP